MIVLGLDPGTAAMGWGVIERRGADLRRIDDGCLTTGPETPMPERLLAVHRCVTDLIELHRPTFVAVERLYFSRNVQTAMAVGQARGVILLAAAQGGVPVREATPSEVKSAVAGYGSADKGQVGRMVAMHVASANPQAIDSSGLDTAAIEREKAVLTDKAKLIALN